jgi:hypothetical protein
MVQPVCDAVRTSHSAALIPHDYPLARFSSCVALSGDFADVWFMEDPHEPMYELAIAAEQLLAIAPGDLLEVFSLLRDQLSETEAVFEMSIADNDHVERITAQASALLSAQELTPMVSGGSGGKGVRSLAELESLVATEYAVAKRRHWPLSVAALRLADGVSRSAAMAAAVRARAQMSDTADIACLDDGRLLILYSGLAAEAAESTTVELLSTLADASGTDGFGTEDIHAGIATLENDDSFSTPENLIRASWGALHAAIRNPDGGPVHRAVDEGEAVALGTDLESFMPQAGGGSTA